MTTAKGGRFGAIHAMKRELGLDDGSYRSLLKRVTGKTSLRDMSPDELGLVAGTLRDQGAGRQSRLGGPYGAKLQALWISGWQLGVVHNRANAALLAFIKAQTGIEHTRFLRDPKDARKAVEALKSWLTREAGVDWSISPDPQHCVIAAQLRLLAMTEGDMIALDGGADLTRGRDRLAAMQTLGSCIRANRGRA
tara:strand:+ start:4052 stop:4633 length:582 start_codon:yes stop_codon:yes gene_type:complete